MEGVPLVTTGSTTTSSGDLSATAPCVSEAGLATETIGTSPTSTTATSTTCASASGGTSNDPRNEKSVYDGRQICGESLCPLLPLVAEKKEKKKKKKKTLRSHDRHKEKKKKKHASKPKKEKQTKKKKHSEKEFSEDEASTRKKRKRHSKSKIDNESDEAVPPSSKKSRKDKKSPKKSKGEDEESELRKVKPPIALTQSHYETRQSCALKDVVQVLTAPNKQVNYVTKEDMTAYTRQLKMVFRIFQKERRDGLMTTRDLDGCLRALGNEKVTQKDFAKSL
ncbi:hypothetical protein Pelo_12790 [Pelomyxa schiedti]|nr:hypothetical protein Pelo_12790 [Pelomyxa schiedti]